MVIRKLLFLAVIMGVITVRGQVGINTTTPEGALDVSSANAGFIPPRLALTSTTVQAPATNPQSGFIVAGTLVWNTATAGTTPNNVTPGFYYWNGTKWVRVGVNNYSVQYNQTGQVLASTSSTTYVNLPGLQPSFTAPYTGTYQIIVTGYYAVGSIVSSTTDRPLNQNGSFTVSIPQDGAGQASIQLTIDGTAVSEKYITSVSKQINVSSAFTNLAQSTTIVVNYQMTAGQTYQLRVRGREWATRNTNTGIFGANTSGYAGSNSVATAQYGSMTVTYVSE